MVSCSSENVNNAISSLFVKVTTEMNIFKRLFRCLSASLFSGVLIGLSLNVSGGNSFFTFFVKHSLTAAIFLFLNVGFLLLAGWLSWVGNSDTDGSKTVNVRMYLLGISLASLVMFIVNIATHLHEAPPFGGGAIAIYDEFPFVTIIGIQFPSIIWSLFSAVLFSTIERVVKVWEDSMVPSKLTHDSEFSAR